MEEAEHDCLEFLQYREHEWYETHGLECGPYERCFQEWWRCAVCGAEFTDRELKELAEEREAREP